MYISQAKICILQSYKRVSKVVTVIGAFCIWYFHIAVEAFPKGFIKPANWAKTVIECVLISAFI